ncbi:hypothetical protein NDU88_006994 [Pleurodeles waltl]|uniref:Uncharacterized protein n=1 Tax=Pleurodeles waltl TaxID=8319 RepID=A0AAV7PK13_PLEWA|nr:hypothetical protein NDU88_006994 [Pleurodeles waltl]
MTLFLCRLLDDIGSAEFYIRNVITRGWDIRRCSAARVQCDATQGPQTPLSLLRGSALLSDPWHCRPLRGPGTSPSPRQASALRGSFNVRASHSASRCESQQDLTRLPSRCLVQESVAAAGGRVPLLQSPAPKPTTRPRQSGTCSTAPTRP